MTLDDITPQRIEAAARLVARRWYQHECPHATDEAALRWSLRNYRKFVDLACEWLARCVLLEENGRRESVPPGGRSA